MPASSVEVLEYAALKELIGGYVSGPLGRAELERVAPCAERATLEASLAELAEAIEFARTQPKLPLGGLVDSSASVQKLRIEGASLEGDEIANLITFLQRATEIRLNIVTEAARFPRLNQRAGGIGEFRLLLRDVAGKVLPNGSVADSASVALTRLRRDIERQQRHIQESLERFVRAHREQGILQEEYVTLRNDRFVVPVVAGQKRRVDGVIHGASGSGQTLFIEPLETIDLNNELVRLREEEAREVHRILREITERLREHAAAIRQTLDQVSAFDLLFAKAAFAIDYDCVIPRFSPDETRRVHLKHARHPVLESVLRREGRRVVPLSVTLDDRVHTLLISGPNTGGKTVAMKTVGLLALMAQSGIAVPAEEAEFPVFDRVLADIGDQQSIEQSLSTFSAHITCIRNMIERATVDSLVLLDELGRATDPEEGGALGVAILEHFRGIKAFTLASTHLLALKIYGANTETVLNGSMGFDENTLQPTYVLHLGAPGKSAGLDIAARLGLPPRVIERARAAMSSTERDIARFLSELHARLEGVSALEADLRRRIEEVDRREAQLGREFEKREADKIRELEGRNAELVARFEADARQTIDSIMQSAENRKAAEQATRKVSRTRREFQEAFAQAVRESSPAAAPGTPQIHEGARVRLRGVRSPARVRRVLPEEKLEVEAGFMKMQVSRDDVEEVLPPEAEAVLRLPKNVTFRQTGPRWDVPYSELNLIGKRAEEATEELDKFLDQAALAQVMRVRIIHGHGMGVLKRAVSEYLKNSPHVEKFYPASEQEGGTGATIAELKEG
ncbi:MAG TPA: endonuclease MutS2 [Bryobacteraceae bacterium]|nr:endonuclease MutS2 [Bryobacteraceae bacterium]